jgi:hypothetical protein
MHSQTAEHWELKAAQARDASRILADDGAKETMLEMAAHYEKLAADARAAGNARKLAGR